MAKTLVEFDGELLDVMTIFRVSRRELWNEKREEFDYCLILNPGFPESYLVKDVLFTYESFDLREKKLAELKNKIGELEHIHIL